MVWSDDVCYRGWPADSGVRVHPVECGDGHIDAWWNLDRVVQPHWVLYRIGGDGAELILADGTRLVLHPEVAWLLPPWLEYSRRTVRVAQQWIHFEVGGLSPSAVAQWFRAPLALPPDARLDSACAAMRLSLHDRDHHPLRVRLDATIAAAAGFAIALAALSDPARRQIALDVVEPRLAAVFQHIEGNLGLPLYNDGLARICGLSKPHFCRLFRETTGQSPAQYVIERRIARAASLLLTSGIGIEALAESCGFTDRFAFTRVFTRRMHRSPAAYRKGHARPDAETG